METSFGNWIKRRRKALDLTQGELAKRIGCSMSAIYKIEADERRPSRQVAELLAAHLEIPDDKHTLFLKVARQEKSTARLEEVSPVQNTTPAPASYQSRSNLPVFPTQFVGREHEISIVTNLIQDPACRLLTLTGPGGIGKTRLAVEVARKIESDFPHGALFLPMATVNQPELIIPVLADGLGIIFSGPADPKLQVTNTLRNKKVLLIFDNMEHIIAGSDLLGEILEQCPDVKLLLTSREQVHLQWEWIFEVQGLPIPDGKTASALQNNSAATLFLNRARQVIPDLLLTDEEAAALVHICSFVDGLPLAIELAASWIRIMSFQEIALELKQNLNLLTTSMHDVPARHRSMEVVFDHSWALLTVEERILITRLAAFPGGFTRRAAETVADASLVLLSSLVSKSLLRYYKNADHYDFHELIRQYASAQLRAQPEEEERLRVKHSQYYAGWVADLEEDLKGPQQLEISRRMLSETANWNSAWQWAADHQRLDLLRQMLTCLAWYFEIHSYYEDALSFIQSAVNKLRAAGMPGTLITPSEKSAFASLTNQLGWVLFRMGNLVEAVTLYESSLELAHETGDQEALFYIHNNWAYLTLLNGDVNEAKRLNLESLTNAHQLGSQWHIAIPITMLGNLEYQAGNLVESYRQLQDSLEIWRAVGDPRGMIFCMLYLVTTLFAMGDLDPAERILQESYAISKDKHDRWAQSVELDLLGQVCMLKGQIQNGRELFQQSLAHSQEIGDPWGSTQTLIHLGEAQAALQGIDDAKQLFREAYLKAQQGKWAPTALEALVALASIDDQMPVETKLEIALSILSHSNTSPPTYQRATQLRDQLLPAMSPQQIEMSQAHAAEIDPLKMSFPL